MRELFGGKIKEDKGWSVEYFENKWNVKVYFTLCIFFPATKTTKTKEGEFKKAARLREAASAKPGPARPQPIWQAERTGEYVRLTNGRERRWRTLRRCSGLAF